MSSGHDVSDAFLFLANVGAPLATGCAVVLTYGCIRRKHWPNLAVFALLVFLATSAGLGGEGILLERDYGVDVATGIWWLPVG
jgi:hypothetical protein